jgi:hypothetical protein
VLRLADPALCLDESRREDPLIDERRRLDVKLDALRRDMASRPVETPGWIRTLVDELIIRWRRQLRRSLSGGVKATTWIIAFLLLSIALLAVVAALNVYEPVWALLLRASI